MPDEDYRGITLPKELIQQIDEIIKNKKLGYKTNAEFIKEAIREHLARRKKELQDDKQFNDYLESKELLH